MMRRSAGDPVQALERSARAYARAQPVSRRRVRAAGRAARTLCDLLIAAEDYADWARQGREIGLAEAMRRTDVAVRRARAGKR